MNVSGHGHGLVDGLRAGVGDVRKGDPGRHRLARHTITVSNTTSATMPITSTSLAGREPQELHRDRRHLLGHDAPPGASAPSSRVRALERRPANRASRVTDTGSVAPHVHELTLTGNATFPNNPKSVTGSVGCSSTHVRWVAPTATRFAGTIVVRNHAHYPTSTGDGTRVPHMGGVATDRGLKHFTTYYYRVFATLPLAHPHGAS